MFSDDAQSKSINEKKNSLKALLSWPLQCDKKDSLIFEDRIFLKTVCRWCDRTLRIITCNIEIQIRVSRIKAMVFSISFIRSSIGSLKIHEFFFYWCKKKIQFIYHLDGSIAMLHSQPLYSVFYAIYTKIIYIYWSKAIKPWLERGPLIHRYTRYIQYIK